MKKAIVYSTLTKNTEILANTINETIENIDYMGKATDDVLDYDVFYIGSWTTNFSCSLDIEKFLGKLNNKKIFIFMTAGYGNSIEFFENILNNVKKHINPSNEIIGEFICQGKVSEQKKEAIKNTDLEKFKSIEDKLIQGNDKPNLEDIESLKNILNK